MRLGLGKSPRFDAWLAQQGRSSGRWGSRPGRYDDYTFQDAVIDGQGQGDDDEEPATRGVMLTLPGDVVDWITERAEELGMTASDVVADAIQVRAALDVAPQIADLVRRGDLQEHE